MKSKSPITRRAALAALVSATACPGLSAVSRAADTPTGVTAPIVKRALWVWDATTITSSERRAALIDFCTAQKIGVVYVSMGDLFSERKRETTDPRHVTADQLGTFVQALHMAKVEVEGLDGDPSFSLTENHARALNRFVAALNYNKAAAPAAKLDGWQWDTEPYVLPAFKKDAEGQKQILAQYLDSAAAMCAAAKAAPEAQLRLGYAIPSFFDQTERSLEWGGATKAPAFHLMDQLNALPAAYIAIMAYRDKAEGTNGTIAISQGEMDYAAAQTPKVKVWIGQETADVKGDPPSITFWQEGTGVMETELAKVSAAFGSKAAFGGLALHHYASYKELLAKPVAAAP